MHYLTSRRSWRRLSMVAAVLLVAAAGVARAESPRAGAELTPLDRTLESQGFELINQKHGIKVYKHRTSRIIRIAGEGVMPAPIGDVREVITDYRGQAGKVDRVSESRVLREGANWLLVYQRLNLPIISDRDYTLMVRWGEDHGVQWVTFDSASWLAPPPRDGIVRVTDHHGSWQLRSVEGGRATFVRFQTRIDLGGSLPRWMARAGAGKEVPNVFANLCRLTDPRRRSRPCP
jgi:hypothetical protein